MYLARLEHKTIAESIFSSTVSSRGHQFPATPHYPFPFSQNVIPVPRFPSVLRKRSLSCLANTNALSLRNLPRLADAGPLPPTPRQVGVQASRGTVLEGAQRRRRGRFAHLLPLRLRLEDGAAQVYQQARVPSLRRFRSRSRRPSLRPAALENSCSGLHISSHATAGRITKDPAHRAHAHMQGPSPQAGLLPRNEAGKYSRAGEGSAAARLPAAGGWARRYGRERARWRWVTVEERDGSVAEDVNTRGPKRQQCGGSAGGGVGLEGEREQARAHRAGGAAKARDFLPTARG